MGGSRKSKLVTWASDVNLCQVRLFLSEESPSQVRMGTQDDLQAKALWPLTSGVTGSDDSLPPGFDGIQPANPWRAKLSQIPLAKWRCPPSFEVDSSWQVVAGEESRESEAQSQREMSVLEAIYPRPSSIPPNPSVSAVPEDSNENNQFTSVVPITPVEDEDVTIDTPQVSMAATGNPMINCQLDAISATGIAALNSVMSQNNDQGSPIDSALLIKILSNPKLIEQLVTNQTTTSSAQPIPPSTFHSIPAIRPQQMPPSSLPGMQSIRMQSPASSSTQYSSHPKGSFDPTSTAAVPFHPPSRAGPFSNLRPDMISAASRSVTTPMTKDANYYKSLIQQHGEERRETMPQYTHQSNHRFPGKPRIMKPCIFFNSSRGCRNGANCAYQHDMSSQNKASSFPEIQNAKRMKLDREITGA